MSIFVENTVYVDDTNFDIDHIKVNSYGDEDIEVVIYIEGKYVVVKASDLIAAITNATNSETCDV